ncbi:MAG: hypothetical protein JSW72_10025 [Candidatus Bathyarchaeota archaeon]|nr:MAG: hypothetical protein JSW72_10025 [Candidatus Bathyarchaeota archaeon]
MKPLSVIYWIRATLGLIIGVACALYVYSMVTVELTSIYTLLTGVSFALLFYMATYYLIKSKYFGRVEKQSKLVTQGIGIYFFAWIVSWTLIVTLFMPSVTVYINNSDGTPVEGLEMWVVAETGGGQIIRNMSTLTGTLRMPLLPPGTYILRLGDRYGYISDQNETLSLGWLQSEGVTFSVPLTGE